MTTREPAADGAAPSPSPHAGRVELPGGWHFEPLPWPNGDERDPEDMVYDLVTPEGDLLGQEWDAGDVRAFAAALARAAPAGGAVPAGYQLVPIEPTPEMIRAGGDGIEGGSGANIYNAGFAETQAERTWSAMLAEVPAPIPAAPGEGRAVENDYTNHASIRSVRTVIPTGRLLPGDDVYHPGARWVIEAWDVAKGAMRTFDPAHVHRWGDQEPRQTSTVADHGPGDVDLVDALRAADAALCLARSQGRGVPADLDERAERAAEAIRTEIAAPSAPGADMAGVVAEAAKVGRSAAAVSDDDPDLEPVARALCAAEGLDPDFDYDPNGVASAPGTDIRWRLKVPAAKHTIAALRSAAGAGVSAGIGPAAVIPGLRYALRILRHPNAGMEPPDGGSPTQEDRVANVAEEIEELIARLTPAASPAAAETGEAVK